MSFVSPRSISIVSCIATAVLEFSSACNAAVTVWNCNLVIPANSAGLFINIETQQVGSTGASVLGWDMNIYSNYATPSLAFYGYVGTGFLRYPGALFGPIGSFTSAPSVGPADSFTAQATETEATFGTFPGNWRLNAVNYFGLRFNASDGLRRYAYGVMSIGATANIRTLQTLVWGTEIPAPGALALIGLAGVARRRRRG